MIYKLSTLDFVLYIFVILVFLAFILFYSYVTNWMFKVYRTLANSSRLYMLFEMVVIAFKLSLIYRLWLKNKLWMFFNLTKRKMMKTQIKLYKQLAIYYTLKIAFEFMLWIFLTLIFAIVAVEKFGVKSYSLLFTIFLVLSIASGVLCFTFSIVENMNRSRILARWVFNFCILVPYKSLDSKAFYLGAKLDKLCYAANIDEKTYQVIWHYESQNNL